MPAKILSQDPLVRASQPSKNFDDMKMVSFHADFDGTKTRLKVLMQPYDHATSELLDSADPYFINIKNLENQATTSPKFDAAWDTINEVMGLAYDFFRLREKVQEAIANDQDPSALIIQRDAALVALQAPVP